jgi:uncharacterized repeat protein (TIGR01451 family)/fimbrial isopeptide formation D2 family protein
VDDLGNAVSLTTTTGVDGSYTFGNLRPGSYALTETQPGGLLDGLDVVGTLGGTLANDSVSVINVAPGNDGTGYNFGELQGASISGAAYIDADNDGVFDAGETGLAGVTITLTGTDDLGNAVSLTTTTAADGSYSFGNLRPGSYTLTETQPAGLLDGLDSAGTPGGGVAGNDVISAITLTSGLSSVGNNFAELRPASLGGFVFNDADNDGVFDGTESGVAGVTVTLSGTDDLGNVVNITTISGIDGSYVFGTLRPGTYTITQTQPAGLLDGLDTIGTQGGTLGNDVFSNIVLTEGTNGTDNNFGELSPSSLSGSVFVDLDGDGVRDPFESGIVGVEVALTGVDDLGNPVALTTTTAPDGSYNFPGLRPSGPGGYTIRQTQPAGYADGLDTVGTQGGLLAAPDDIVTAAILPGTNGAGNNFGELFVPALTKTLVGTSSPGTSGNNLAIGEVATFRLAVTVPTGALADFQILDALPVGMRFLNGSAVAFGIGVAGLDPVIGLVLADAQVSASATLNDDTYASGTDVYFKFGTLNTIALTGTVIVEFQAIVLNEAANQNGASLANTFTHRYDFTGDGVAEDRPEVSNPVVATVAEPILALDKAIASPAGPVAVGTTITYTITITHAAGSAGTAWEATLTDAMPTGLRITSIVSTTLADGAQEQSAAAIIGGGTGLSGIYDIPVGGSVIVTYQALVTSEAVLGSSLNNAADLTWTSLEGTDANERGSGDSLLDQGGLNDYEVIDNATISVLPGTMTLDKIVVGDANAEIGERLSFQITLTVPDGLINNLSLVDVLPSGFVLVAGSESIVNGAGVLLAGVNFTYAPGGFTLDIAQVQSAVDGNANTITITYQVDVLDSAANDALAADPSKTNTATATYDAVTASDSATLTVVEPVIAVAKSVLSAPNPLQAGGTITYQVVISHAAASTGTAFNVSFADALPAGLGSVTIIGVGGTAAVLPDVGDFLVAGTNITTLVPFDLALGETVVLTYTAVVQSTATPGQILTNAVTVTVASTESSPSGNVRTPASATNGGNYDDTDSVTLTVDPGIALTKTASVTQAVIGDRVIYTLVIKVIEGTTPGLLLTDVLPDGPQLDLGTLTFTFGAPGMSAGNAVPLSFAGNTITGDFGDLSNPADGDATNDFLTITYETVIVDAPANVSGSAKQNVATVTYTGLATPVTADATVTIVEPELNIEKTASDTTPRPGSVITFTLTITHTGASTADAFDLAIVDVLPAGLSLDAASITLTNAPAGTSIVTNTSANGGALGLVLNQLALGESITITYQAAVTTDFSLIGGSYGGGDDAFTNTASLTYDTQPGTPPDGERTKTSEDSEVVTVTGADLSVTKDNSLTSVVPGQTVTYTIVVTNNGTGAATNVLVTDTLPLSGIVFVSAPGGAFDAAAGTVTFNLATLGAGESQTFTVTVSVNAPAAAGFEQITNTTTVTHDDPDPTPDNNTDEDVDPVVAAPDYVITKTDGVTSALPGQTLTYTIVVTNQGNQDGTGVVVSDTFLTGLFSSVVASNGGVVDLATGTVVWNLGALGAGQSVTLTLSCVLNGTFADIPGGLDNNAIRNTVTVTDDGANGPDPTPGNNTATDEDDLVPQPDLRIRKTDGVLVAKPGQVLVYRIVATNDGAQNSNGTVVTDVLPAGVTFLSAASSNVALTGQPQVINGRVVWTFDQPFAPGASVVLTVRVQVNANADGTTLQNVVTIRDDGRYGADLTPGNNRATDTDTVPAVPEPKVPPPPFFFAFDSFNNFAAPSGIPRSFSVSSPDVYRDPILPVVPIYSGEADPGATIYIELFNPNGERIGEQTVVVDSGGNWLATFPNSTIRDVPATVRLTQQPASYSRGDSVGHNLRTYFSPALNPGHFLLEGTRGDAFITGRSAPLLAGLVLENPLSLGAVKYGGELLASQAVAGAN